MRITSAIRAGLERLRGKAFREFERKITSVTCFPWLTMKTDQPRWEGARWWLRAWPRDGGARACAHTRSRACYVRGKNKGPASLQALVLHGAAPRVEKVLTI